MLCKCTAGYKKQTEMASRQRGKTLKHEDKVNCCREAWLNLVQYKDSTVQYFASLFEEILFEEDNL